ncbi:HET-domain-containing protein [Zopfia rhizophila CBS 207.26]|uniref:HET-domain-containing protein n=1 Tax=Zopfia rhizophila CBS 207.26 TaxID=1314779 RepID=A0A6A6E123_9PEZI|nr:HET-domain-containing protein [Zopfia rhizophila CBS 207.26]
MSSTSSLYEYRPLHENIRILYLGPAENFSDPVEASLLHCDVFRPVGCYDDPPPSEYEAVSYCWGEKPDFSHSLTCDGQTLKITANVDSLLRHLRRPTRPRSLWIDAICINQEDVEEKAVQVRLMGAIFRGAQKVHIWLGEAAPEDHISWTFAVLKKAAASSNQDIISPYEDGSLMDDNEDAVPRFLSRPWFRRRWVLQEVALAHDITVRCGPYKTSWNSFVEGISVLKSHVATQTIRLNPEATGSVETLAAISSGSHHILDLMFNFHATRCSDPRDRLFALSGMARGISTRRSMDMTRIYMGVDYSKDWPSTYMLFAQECVISEHAEDLLQHAVSFSPLSQQDDKWPSWVPNWSKERLSPYRFLLEGPSNFDYRIPSYTSVSKHSGLQIKGALHGPVQILPDEPVRSEEQPFLLGLAALLDRIASAKPSSQSKSDTRVPLSMLLAQVLCAAALDAQITSGSASTYLRDYCDKYGLDSPSFTSIDGVQYKTTLERLQDSLNRSTQEVLESSDPCDSIKEDSSEAHLLRGLQEPLKNHKLFFTVSTDFESRTSGRLGRPRSFTDAGKDIMPGVGLSEIREGDFVFRPCAMISRNCTPSSFAFLVRPFRDTASPRSRTDLFRLVGVCFFAPFEEGSGQVDASFKDIVLI